MVLDGDVRKDIEVVRLVSFVMKNAKVFVVDGRL